jgi:hypothetical protein
MLDFKQISTDLGFSSVRDFVTTTLGIKGFGFVMLQISFAGLAGFVAFIENWIYYPSSSVFIMCVLIFADCFLGFLATRKLEKKWDRSQLNRFVPLLLTRVFLMSMGFHLNHADQGAFSWIPEAIFGYFTAQHAISILQHLTDLKLIKPTLLQIFGARIYHTVPKTGIIPSQKPEKENG